MFTSWDAGKMSSWLHVTNLMFVFVATFRKYLGSFVEEMFLISLHYTQFLFEAEILYALARFKMGHFTENWRASFSVLSMFRMTKRFLVVIVA